MNIPTAKELFYAKFKKEGGIIDHESLFEYAIELAKLHCKAQAKIISEKVQISPELYDFVEESFDRTEWFDKDSILNAYPLENIK